MSRLFAAAAACGFVLFAVLDLTGHGSGTIAKLVVLASIACVAALRFVARYPARP